MAKLQAVYKNGRSTFSRPVRTIEVRPDAKVHTGGPSAVGMKLASKKSTSAAGRLLYSK